MSASSSSPSLPVLPAELIKLVFAAVDDQDHATCAAVCASGTLGYGVAISKLYHTASNLDYKPQTSPLSLLTQCQVLAETPKLARHVRVIDLCLPAYDSISELQDRVKVEALINETWLRMLGLEFDHLDEAYLYEHIDYRTEFYLFVLLGLCPNIEYIKLSGNIPLLGEFNELVQILELVHSTHSQMSSRKLNVNAQETSWHRVREIQLCPGSAPNSDVEVQQVEYLLWFPSLERMSIDGLRAGIPWDTATQPRPSMRSNLSKLVLTNFSGNNGDLDFLFATCTQLESVHVMWAVMGNENWGRIDWPRLGASVSRSLPQLKKLVLDYHDSKVDDRGQSPLTESTAVPVKNRHWTFSFFKLIQTVEDASVPVDALREVSFRYARESVSSTLPRKMTVRLDAEQIGEKDRDCVHDPSINGSSQFNLLNGSKTRCLTYQNGEFTEKSL